MPNLIEVIFKGINQVGQASEEVKASLTGIQDVAVQSNDALSRLTTIEGAQALRVFKDAAVDTFRVAGAAAMEFVDAAAEAELVGVRMEATIKALGDQAPTTARQINDLADELSKLTGFDDEALVEAQATMARIGSVSEDNFERATRAATDLAAATGMDLNTAFQQVAMAMQNADFGRLARQIGDLPPEMQAAAKAALEMGDTLKVQEIVLAGIEQKVAGAGEALGETFTGEMNKLRTEYGNFQEAIGLPLINLFTGLPDPIQKAGFMIYSLGQTFGPVVSSVADLAIATRGLNAALGGQGLIGLLNQVRVAGATSFGPMLIQLGLVAIAVAAVVAVWMQWNEQIVKTNEEGQKAVESAWTGFFKDLEASGKSGEEILAEYRAAQERTNQVLQDTNPIVRAFVFNKKDLAQADEELLASLTRVTGSQEEAKRLMAEYAQKTKEAGQATVQTSQDVQRPAGFFDNFSEHVRVGFANMWAQAGQSVSMIGTIVQLGFQQLVQHATVGFSLMVLQATQSSQQIVKIVQVLWQRVVQTFQQWISRVVSQVQNFWTNLKTSFQRIATDAINWGRSIVDGVWTGIQNAWASLLANIQLKINALPEYIKKLIGYGSPATVFIPIGESIPQGIGAGFVAGMAALAPMVRAAIGGLAVAPALALTAPSLGSATLDRSSAPVFAQGGASSTTINVTGGFYSPLTRHERRVIRKEQEEAAQREVLRSLR